jgi:uncharacterized membrane protein YhaH (DUF805 family)
MPSHTVRFWEHFRRIADFNGREDRASFWPYAAFVFVLSMIGTYAVMLPPMFKNMQAMQEYAATHPDQMNVVSAPGQYSMSIEGNHPEFMPNMAGIATGVGIVFLVIVLLYAVAVARRLHDRNLSGFWGLMPVPFLAYSFIQMPRVFGAVGSGHGPDMNLFYSIFFSNMLYIITLIALIVLLARRSDQGANRYDQASA